MSIFFLHIHLSIGGGKSVHVFVHLSSGFFGLFSSGFYIELVWDFLLIHFCCSFLCDVVSLTI